jgi:serine/threonine-protein kinase HipA
MVTTMPKVSVLDVLLYGEPIGTLTRVDGDRNLFAFNEDYIGNASRATLSLGYKDQYGELLTEFRPYQTRLMPFFSNLLPEERMRDYLAARAGVNPEREFFLIWALGRDLPGAVTMYPADGEDWPPDASTPIDEAEQRACSSSFLHYRALVVGSLFRPRESVGHG